MSKKDEGAASRCEKCGIVLMFGPAHNCKPRSPLAKKVDDAIDRGEQIYMSQPAPKAPRKSLNKVTTITETPAGTFIDEEADIPEAAIKSKTSIATKAERRAGKKQLSVWIDAGLDRQMRIAVAEDVMRLEAWIEKVLREYLARRGR